MQVLTFALKFTLLIHDSVMRRLERGVELLRLAKYHEGSRFALSGVFPRVAVSGRKTGQTNLYCLAAGSDNQQQAEKAAHRTKSPTKPQ